MLTWVGTPPEYYTAGVDEIPCRRFILNRRYSIRISLFCQQLIWGPSSVFTTSHKYRSCQSVCSQSLLRWLRLHLLLASLYSTLLFFVNDDFGCLVPGTPSSSETFASSSFGAFTCLSIAISLVHDDGAGSLRICRESMLGAEQGLCIWALGRMYRGGRDDGGDIEGRRPQDGWMDRYHWMEVRATKVSIGRGAYWMWTMLLRVEEEWKEGVVQRPHHLGWGGVNAFPTFDIQYSNSMARWSNKLSILSYLFPPFNFTIHSETP